MYYRLKTSSKRILCVKYQLLTTYLKKFLAIAKFLMPEKVFLHCIDVNLFMQKK